ncbi:MAG: hypothetical protein ABSC64_06365 [Candidatus Korobacteraceae bacterium]|jgi:hypothetical protein
MRGPKVLAAGLLLVASALMAQEIPAGTVIPVMLRTTLDARKARVGQKIEAQVMQDIPLSSQTRIRAGAKLVGHVVEVTRPSAASGLPGSRGSRIAVSFDRLMIGGTAIPVTMSLRSLASMMEVFEAQLPTNAIDDYGTTPADWVTVQIGGDVVYRGNGTVMTDGQVVGKSTIGGEVTAKLIASRDGACHGAAAANDREQALWLFSPSACGAYGFAELKIVHAGRHDPVGQIILASDKNVHVPGGSGLLLRVTAVSDPSSIGSTSGVSSARQALRGPS